jgi:hypothetical protein
MFIIREWVGGFAKTLLKRKMQRSGGAEEQRRMQV